MELLCLKVEHRGRRGEKVNRKTICLVPADPCALPRTVNQGLHDLLFFFVKFRIIWARLRMMNRTEALSLDQKRSGDNIYYDPN